MKKRVLAVLLAVPLALSLSITTPAHAAGCEDECHIEGGSGCLGGKTVEDQQQEYACYEACVDEMYGRSRSRDGG